MRILLVEDNPGDIRLLQEYLLRDSSVGFQFTHADRLSRALERLKEADFDVVLLDLSLPDSQGTDTLARMHAAANGVPIVVLTSIDDESLGMQLIQVGAQDYLVKGEVTGPLLRRSLRYAVERQRGEKELFESESRLRAILDNSPGLVFLKDLEGRYLHVNRQFERAFHISRKAIAGKTDKEVFPAEQAAAFRANDLKVLRAGLPLEFEEVALQDDGPHTSIVYKFPLYDGDGRLYAICGITTDITHRKAMEKALQQAEEKYRDIFDNAVEGIFQSTPGGRYLSVNPALARMYGYESPEELMRNVTDITHEVYVDPDCRRSLLQLLESRGVVQGFEYEVRRKDGSKIWISESVRAVRDDRGEVLYYEGAIEDITERKRSEEERQKLVKDRLLLLESMGEGMYGIDLQGRCTFINKAAARMLGYRPDEVLGKPMHALIHHSRPDGSRYPSEEWCVYRSFHGGQGCQVDDEMLWRKDGTGFPAEYSASPIMEGKAIVGAVVTFTDITERKRSEEELQRTLAQLRTLSRRLEVVREEERTRIARELHDELGVRLTCLKMDLSRLSEGSRPKLEEKTLSMIEQVDTTIAAVQSLVAELRPGVLDDLGLVAAIEWQCRDFERRSGIRCVVDTKEEDIPLDPARATAAFRICQEALINVLRHARAKAIRVHLAKIDRQLLLEIHDDGEGILPEKVTDARSLGLLGMRERADAVGGALQIIGLPAQGTTVTLRLPCE